MISSLYKYRSLSGDSREYSRRAIVNLELYMARPSQFNDPFEFYFNVVDGGTDWAPAIAALEGVASSLTPEEMARRASGFPAFLRQSLEREFGILSLSAQPDHILMWSHYADMHRGICLIIDPTALTEVVDDLGPVSYADAPMRIIAQDLVGPESFPENLLRTKARVWDYEGEWRAVRFAGGSGTVVIPDKALQGVILGHRIAADDIDAVKEWARQSPAQPAVYTAQAATDHYGLIFDPPLPGTGR